MLQVLAGGLAGVGEVRPVPRQERRALGELGEPAQRVEVVGERALVVPEHGGAAAQDGVAGQDAAVVVDHQAQRVVGVPRRHQDAQVEPRHGQAFARGEALGAEGQRRVERTDRGGDPLGERPRGLGVVEVSVGQHHELDGPAGLEPVEVRRVLRAGVDDDAPGLPRGAQDPGVGAVQRHR